MSVKHLPAVKQYSINLHQIGGGLENLTEFIDSLPAVHNNQLPSPFDYKHLSDLTRIREMIGEVMRIVDAFNDR